MKKLLSSKATYNLFATLLFACALFFSGQSVAVSIELKGEGIAGLEVNMWGLAQIGAEQIDRDNARNNLEFGSDKVRFGAKVKWDKWYGGLQFDAKGSGDNPSTLPNFIRDAFIGYKFDNAFVLKFGQYKTPVGMAYNYSGGKLPLIKRTMTSRLVLNRDIGLMLSGRKMGWKNGGFGYDIGFFNPADRSKAVSIADEQKGEDYAYAARLSYDLGKMFHVEASLGAVENAGGANTEDYVVYDVGMLWQHDGMRARAEYLRGNDVRGVDGTGEYTWFVEGGYAFTDIIEGVARYQSAEYTPAKGGAKTDLDRYEIGVNLFFGPNKTNGRLQLNYAWVSGDEEKYAGVAGGGNNKYDALLAQLQFAF